MALCVGRAGDGRTTWRHRRAATKAARTPPAPSVISHADPKVAEAFRSPVSLRCPHELICAGLRRVGGIRTPEGLAALRDGESFVCQASDLIGGADSPLLKWDVKYLLKHVPPEMEWPVFCSGTGKIVMTHSNRHLTAVELNELEARGRLASPDPRFRPVKRTMMTMRQFVAATKAHEAAIARGEKSEPPYLGTDVLWRNSMADNGNIQNLGERLKSELLTGANFASLKAMMDAGQLPLMKQVHLFVGSARTLYHCHYDLQPNLHVQLVGRKRFLVFPPKEYERLHAFPVYHEFDRRSRVDLDAPDPAAFEGCTGARGFVVELTPGECLYLPPGWWHHVQTCSSPCVSMAWWFFDRTKQMQAKLDAAGAGGPGQTIDLNAFGLGPSNMELLVVRWYEEAVGKVLDTGRKTGTREAALAGEAAGNTKLQLGVERVLRRLGWLAASRLLAANRQAGEPADPIALAMLDGVTDVPAAVVAEEAAEGPLPPFVQQVEFGIVEDTLWQGVAEVVREQRGTDRLIAKLCRLRTLHAAWRTRR